MTGWQAGEHADTLEGGAGADTFLYLDGDSDVGNADLILDFSGRLDGDKIDFSRLAGDLSFRGREVFSAAGQGEVRYEERGGGTQDLADDYTHVFVDVDGDGQADVEVKLSGLNHNLDADDFLL